MADLVTSVTWAEKELKGYRQVELQPGDETVVSLEIPVSSLAIVDSGGGRVVEPGWFELLVGPSSRDSDLLRARFRVGDSRHARERVSEPGWRN